MVSVVWYQFVFPDVGPEIFPFSVLAETEPEPLDSMSDELPPEPWQHPYIVTRTI